VQRTARVTKQDARRADRQQFHRVVEELLGQLDRVVIGDQGVRQTDECTRQPFVAIHRNSPFVTSDVATSALGSVAAPGGDTA
jgi:hypothetical protein